MASAESATGTIEELKTNTPFSFILFGASGHLAKLKIYPALYTLALKKRLPARYVIMGYARTPMTDEEFRKIVRESVIADMEEINEKVMAEFLSHMEYQAGQYDAEADFDSLERRLADIEDGWGKRVRLAYLSVPPSAFDGIFHNLRESGISRYPDTKFRCIVEKPVGHDLKSFEQLKDTLMSCFKEEEVYLLDHYLGKEAVRNIHYLRYANPVLERMFKNTLIHHVEIVADESDGLEGRAGYFEGIGTLRDFMQSHMLEMLSLLTMRIHESGTIQESRLSALEQLYLPPASSLDQVVFQAQYTEGKMDGKKVAGYLQEEDVPAGSRTNTFVAMKLMSRISRWQGVPFYVRSGKRLQKKETRVSIQFQMPHSVGKGAGPNRLDIILQGEAGMRLHLQTKLGGMEPAYRPLVMEDPLVCVGDCLPEHAVLLLEAIHGKRDWFLTFDEVKASWRLIDPLQAHLDKPETPLAPYPAGSAYPEKSEEWLAPEGIRWFA
jgi:glucose-6-phosphate 1-dehydrogenase